MMQKLMPPILIAGVLLVLWYGLHNPHDSQATVKPQATAQQEPNVLHYPAGAPQLSYLHIAPVEAGQVPTLEPLQGHVTYDEDITSRITAPIAGRITRINAQVGDRVKAGQALLTLDSPDFAQASADVRHAEADVNLKQSAYARAKTLFDGGVLAGRDFEAANGDLQQSNIELDRARARLRNLGPGPSDGFVLRTRVGGIVMDRQVNPGIEVRPDAPGPLFVVSDPARLWVNVEVPEQDLGKIHVGQHLRVESDAYPGQPFDAEVLLIGKVIDPATRRVVVRCRVNNHDEKLKPEMYVRATPLGSEAVMPHVPNEALVTEGVQSFLFVEKSPGVLEKRRVTLGYCGHEESYVLAGINLGNRIVLSGALLLNAELSGN
jgi:cobalt-zinc-cadmium efflux system membrane fusion protein